MKSLEIASAPTPFELAMSPPVARRALGFAVVVGAVLITINHGDAILRGDLEPVRVLKMGLTILVPYVVSTVSSVQAMHMQDNSRSTGDELGERKG